MPSTQEIAIAAGGAAIAAASLGILKLRAGEETPWSQLLLGGNRGVEVSGFVKPGYEAVRNEFIANFENGFGGIHRA